MLTPKSLGSTRTRHHVVRSAMGVGILLAADAGYDPRESVGLWERMAQLSGGGGQAEFLSTHPSHDTRIDQLKEWMPEAMAIYEKRTPVPAALLPTVGGR